jgi:hypothetical protein
MNGITHGFYYEEADDFLNQGITDKYSAYFYIRHVDYRRKYIVRPIEYPSFEITTNMKLVISLDFELCSDDVKEIILSQLVSYEGIVVSSYTDETDTIYQSEYSEPANGKLKRHFMFEFSATSLRNASMNPICLSLC